MKSALGLGLLGVWLLAACGGDGTGLGDAPSASVTDARADTFATPIPDHVQPDLVALRVTRTPDAVTITLTFAQAVQPNSEAVNAVAGIVDLDTDQNPATGDEGGTDDYRPAGSGSTGLGVDYTVYLVFGPNASSVTRQADGQTVGTLQPSFSGTRVTLRVPLTLLGNDDGYVDVATVIGTPHGPTDIAPNSGHLSLSPL